MVALSEPQLDLAACHLPPDYYELGNGSHQEQLAAKGKCPCPQCTRKRARMTVLISWFDPKRPNVLCTNLNNFLAAMHLWNEYYMKPDPWNDSRYFWRDPLHKYEMIAIAMARPKSRKQPSKGVVHAPRGTTKTVTLIQEMCLMIAICRPKTIILITEANTDRVVEEIDALSEQVENNQRIQTDFGGRGKLYPKSRLHGDKWNSRCLTFIHHNSKIWGYSVNSKMRGRHPHLVIIDDPEDEEAVENTEFRRKYMRWLFHTALHMLHPGGHLLWIGTVLPGHSCLDLALRGLLEPDSEDRDKRFDDWTPKRFEPIRHNADGEPESIFPDKWDLEDIERMKQTHGLASVMAELWGRPIADGEFCLRRDRFEHGYMHCEDDEGEYLLDLKTGERENWEEILDRMFVAAAMDPADSLRADACPGAIVVIGILGKIIYVLDAWIKRANSDVLTRKAFDLCQMWGASLLAIEKCGMQRVVVRSARRCADALRDQGKTVPFLKAMLNHRREKNARIASTLIPCFAHREIRLPYFDPVTLEDKLLHKPLAHHNRRYLAELMTEIDGFTEDGAAGWVDGLDALEMTIRASARQRGQQRSEPEDQNERQLQRWEDLGLPTDRSRIPHELWTRKMNEDYWREEGLSDGEEEEEVDVYAYC